MNILLINWRDTGHPRSGGAEIVTKEHAVGWVRRGHTVTWLTAHYDGALHDEVLEGVRMVRRMGSLTLYFFVPLYLFRNSRHFDVIIDQMHGFPFFTTFFTRKPIVVFIHEVAGVIWDYMFPFPKNVIGKLLERISFVIYKRNLFWTDATSTIEDLVRYGIPKNQCYAIPCPITKPKNLTVAEKKEKKPTFVFVSRVVRMKGIEDVLSTFVHITRSLPDARLWIVGNGEVSYVQELERTIVDYGISEKVTFYGYLPEERKYDLLSRAHVLLHASVKEGWGLVVLEAASVGTPSVVYNVHGLTDVVKNGKTGIVVPVNKPEELAMHAVDLYKNKQVYAVFQKNGKAWVDSLKWDDVISQSSNLLQKAIQFS